MIAETDLLAEIRRLADGESPPTAREMNSDGQFTVKTYRNRFGSWNKAVRAAGYDLNKHHNISETELLTEICRLADGDTPPTATEMRSDGKFVPGTYHNRFGSWWQAVVRAGCSPHYRRPLTDQEFERMVIAAHNQQKTHWELVGLLHLFTGLPVTYVSAITADRVTTHATGTVVTIPGAETQSGDDWQFKLPATWDDGRKTGLPGLLAWYLDFYEQVNIDRQTAQKIIHRLATDAEIERQTTDTEFGPAPDVTPEDLRTTGGIRMARNGAPVRRIRRHLGIDHTGWDASVEDFFVWCEVHDEDFSHPDWNPEENPNWNSEWG